MYYIANLKITRLVLVLCPIYEIKYLSRIHFMHFSDVKPTLFIAHSFQCSTTTKHRNQNGLVQCIFLLCGDPNKTMVRKRKCLGIFNCICKSWASFIQRSFSLLSFLFCSKTSKFFFLFCIHWPKIGSAFGDFVLFCFPLVVIIRLIKKLLKFVSYRFS